MRKLLEILHEITSDIVVLRVIEGGYGLYVHTRNGKKVYSLSRSDIDILLCNYQLDELQQLPKVMQEVAYQMLLRDMQVLTNNTF